MRWSALWLLVVLAACSRASLPKHWELTISSEAGMCDDTETIACDESWKLSETGPVVHVEHFATGPKETSYKVTAGQRQKIENILRTAAFQEGVTDGFPCGTDAVHDLWVNLRYIDRDSGTDTRRNVTACTLDPNKDNIVIQLSSAVFATVQ